MHKRQTQSLKKEKGAKSTAFTTKDIFGLVDRLEKLDKTPMPRSLHEKRKYLISAYRALFETASYYHQIVTFPSSDPAERDMENDVLNSIVGAMRDVTLQTLDIINSIEGEEGCE